jgi:hypothetical protein
VSELERRRRAIVRALQGVAADAPSPYPAGPTPSAAPTPAGPISVAATGDEAVERERLSRLERDVADVRRHLRALADRLHRDPAPPAAGAPGAPGGSDEPGAERLALDEAPGDDGVREVPPVPDVDPPTPMSDRAARALFGY